MRATVFALLAWGMMIAHGQTEGRSGQSKDSPRSPLFQSRPQLWLGVRRILPSDFDNARRMWRAEQRVVLVVFCQPVFGLCMRTEFELAEAARELARELLPALIYLVDTAEWGGERLRQEWAAATHAPVEQPTLIVFAANGDAHSLENAPRASAVAYALRTMVQSGGAPMSAAHVPPASDIREELGLLDADPADRVIELTSLEQYLELIHGVPLAFVLFFSSQLSQPTLHSNFSAAAEALHALRVPVRLARVEVGASEELAQVARQLHVSELPEVRLFRTSRMGEYLASASAADLVDVARWNAGNRLIRLSSPAVVDVRTPAELDDLLQQHELNLVVFTTKWCALCLPLSTELDAASVQLRDHRAKPPQSSQPHHQLPGLPTIGIGVVHADEPMAAPIFEEFNVFAFPVLKLIYRGRCIGDLSGGLLSHEIVHELTRTQRELRLAEHAATAGQHTFNKGVPMVV